MSAKPQCGPDASFRNRMHRGPSDSFNLQNPNFVLLRPCQMLQKHRILTAKWEKSSLQRLGAMVSCPES